MSRNPHSPSAYRPILIRFRSPLAGWLQVVALTVFWLQPLIPTHAVYVPDDSGAQPPYYWVPTWDGDNFPGNPDFNDADGNGVPDWRDQFNAAAANGTLAWWGGGTFTIDGVSQTFLGQYHPLQDGDRDHDGIPDSLDSHPDDESNNSFYWQGGTVSLNGYTYLVRAQWFAGSSSDSNGNGIPDGVESALQNWSDPQLHWWPGGSFLLNGNWNSYAGQYYYGYDTTDTDGDGIPDVIDPAVNDPWNGTQYWFGGGEWFINGILTHFDAGYHSGFWNDDDWDGLPDDIDPYRGNYYNNSTYWNGGAFLVDGAWQSFPAQYHAANIGDRDGDGIPDDIDPYPDDNSNNTFYWAGNSFTANNQGYYYPSGYYAGSSRDTDSDGIPDTLDPYPNDSSNNNYYQPTFYWSGGWFTVNNSSIYWSSGYYDGYWQDSDNDGIPDSLDAYIWDSNNGNVSSLYWNGGAFTINNQAQYWSPGDYPSLTDSDNDGIPDCVDPYITDPNNGNQTQFYWQGGGYYVDGTYTNCPSGWYSGELFASAAAAGGVPTVSVQAQNGYWLYTKDRDGDGIPDAVDILGDDPTNNTFYWDGGNGRTWYVDGSPVTKSAGYYKGPSLANVGDLGNIPYVIVADPMTNVSRYVADSDGDGLPDCLDDYMLDPLNHSFYWDGGNGRVWYVDNEPTTFTAGYYSGPSSPTPGEAGGPRTMAVYNPNTMVTSYVVDQDNDGIPDDGADPHRDDPNNGTWFYWPPLDGSNQPTSLTYIINNEEHTFTSTLYGGLLSDADGDQIPDVADIDYPDDPYNGNDSDHDGIPDRVEVQYAAYGMDMNNDADAQIVRADGLTNLQAYQNHLALDQTAMDPALDSDGDGMSDVYEIINGLDRNQSLDSVDAPVNHLVNAQGYRDSTGATMNDFILNIEKARAGIPLATVITDAAQYQQITGHPPGEGITQNDLLDITENDWDGDGVSNMDEVLVFHTDPRDPNSVPSEETILDKLIVAALSATTLLHYEDLAFKAQAWRDWLQRQGLGGNTSRTGDANGNGVTDWSDFLAALNAQYADADSSLLTWLSHWERSVGSASTDGTSPELVGLRVYSRLR